MSTRGSPFFLRPPGLSWVLSFVEPDALAPRSMHLVIQGSAVAAVVAVMLAMRRLHGSVMGLVVALLVAVSPLTTGAFNKIFSGLPFLALLFAGAWLVMPGRDGRQVGLWRGFAGAVLLAASLWMRSIGLLILPGLVLVDVFRKEGRRWQGAALAAVVFCPVGPVGVLGLVGCRRGASALDATRLIRLSIGDVPCGQARSRFGARRSGRLDGAACRKCGWHHGNRGRCSRRNCRGPVSWTGYPSVGGCHSLYMVEAAVVAGLVCPHLLHRDAALLHIC